MMRTRDFLLGAVSVVFLLLVLGVSFFTGEHDSASHVDTQIGPATGGPESFSAEVQDTPQLERAAKLQAMRDKIEQKGLISAPEPNSAVANESAPTTDELATADESSTTSVSDVATAQYCPSYAPTVRAWSPLGISFKEVEGSRLVVRTTPSVSASGTPTTADEVLLQLAARSAPAATPSCIASDVVGIAKDGSLIRNNEASLYGVFGPETRIGYALDGFPIYGMHTIRTDECGGAITERGYGYFLSADRAEILHCFSAPSVPF